MSEDLEGETLRGPPVTDTESKRLMLRAERGDTIRIGEYGEFEVKKRTNPYFGPKLILEPEHSDYPISMLTAPGPASDLQLWFSESDEEGFRTGWTQIAEVSAELVDQKQYDICACGEPIKNAEHQKRAFLKIGEHG